MSRRRSVRPPDLTSLFDVLFLFVFVSLVNAGMSKRAADQALAATAPAPKPVAPVRADLIGLRDRALATLADRTEVVARITRDGALARLELGGRTITVGVPLVERVADPDVGVAYLGERSPDLRICQVIAHALGAADLRGALVIIAPEAPMATLTHALVDGLRADADRCLVDERGVAVIVEPPAPGAAP